MRTSATGAVYASSAMNTPVIRRSVITMVIGFPRDHSAVRPSASGSVDTVGTDHSMGLIADRKTA